ncbi:hypothetical protein GCM10025794_02520 [Massilia kyonggiensis]
MKARTPSSEGKKENDSGHARAGTSRSGIKSKDVPQKHIHLVKAASLVSISKHAEIKEAR